MMEDKRKHRFSHTHADIHPDGSMTIEHVHSEGPHKNVKHAALDLDGLHDSLQENLNNDDAAAEAAEERVHPGIHEEIAKMGHPEK